MPFRTKKEENWFFESFRQSRQRLRKDRKRRNQVWRDIGGGHWGNQDGQAPSPINGMEKAFTLYNRLLAAKAPQVNIVSKFGDQKGAALDAEVIVNAQLKEIDAEVRLQRWVAEALTSIGIVKCYVQRDGFVDDPSNPGQQVPQGKTVFDVISFDDWCHDMNAKTIENADWMGHRFRVRMEDIKDNPDYNQRVVSQLEARSRDDNMNDVSGGQRTSQIGIGSQGIQEISEYVDLWEIYFQRERKTVIFADGKMDGPDALEALAEFDYYGPEQGPYHFLYFLEVADNSMPVPPASYWIDLNNMINKLFRKLQRQAENQKTILLVEEDSGDELEKIVNANDMQSISVKDPSAFNEARFNGPDNQQTGFLMTAMNWLNNANGNVDLLSGTSAQSGTAKQDQLLSGSSSERIEKMKDRVYKKTQKLFEDFAWYVWHDPTRTYKGVREDPDLEMSLPVVSTPWQRLGRWQNFNMTIEPYSMQSRSPVERMEEINRIVMQVILPAMPLLQQQGLGLNMREYLKLMAKYNNLPEIKDLIIDQEQQEDPETSIGTRQAAAPVRTTINERRNVSAGGTPESMGQQMMLAGGGGGANQNQGSILQGSSSQ